MNQATGQQEVQDLEKSYGNTELELYAHSRGGMIVYNALNFLEQRYVQGIAGKIEVNFYVPAFNIVMAEGQLEKLSDDKQTHVGFDGHRYEFVSRVIGGNDFTYETVPAGS